MTNLALSETIETLHPRVGDRRRVAVAGRLTWRDTNGALRFASVVTRDVSEADVFVECQAPASIPKFRLVHFQVERAAQGRADLPAVLRAGKPGQTVQVVFVQRGREVTADALLDEDPRFDIVAAESVGESLTDAQKAFRQSWLAGR